MTTTAVVAANTAWTARNPGVTEVVLYNPAATVLWYWVGTVAPVAEPVGLPLAPGEVRSLNLAGGDNIWTKGEGSFIWWK